MEGSWLSGRTTQECGGLEAGGDRMSSREQAIPLKLKSELKKGLELAVGLRSGGVVMRIETGENGKGNWRSLRAINQREA